MDHVENLDQEWTSKEFAEIDLKDKRLNKRVQELAKALEQQIQP